MSKNEIIEEILDLYSRKMFLDREPELYRDFERHMYTLPEEVLESYLENARKLNPRADTELGRKQGLNKLAVLYDKMHSPIKEYYDPQTEKDRSVQEDVELNTPDLETMMMDMQENKLDRLGGDSRFTEHLYKMEDMIKEHNKRAESYERIQEHIKKINSGEIVPAELMAKAEREKAAREAISSEPAVTHER